MMIGLFLLSCSLKPLWNTGDATEFAVQKMEKVILLEFVLVPHEETDEPNIEDIAADIMKDSYARRDTFCNYFAKKYIDVSGDELLYGDKLYNSEEYKVIKKHLKEMPSARDDDLFPEVITPTGAANFFDFYEDSPYSVIDLGNLRDNYQSSFEKICNETNVNGLIIVAAGCGVHIKRTYDDFLLHDRIPRVEIIFYSNDSKDFAIVRSLQVGIYLSGQLRKSAGAIGSSWYKMGNYNHYLWAMENNYLITNFILDVLFEKKPNDIDYINFSKN